MVIMPITKIAHLKYQLIDCSSGQAFVGVVSLGEVLANVLSDDVIKENIKQMIKSVQLLLSSRLYIVCQLYGPLDSLLKANFSGLIFRVDVARNTGIPRYILNQGTFKIDEYTIMLSTRSLMDTLF